MKKWLAQAPANIALIKYMGKQDNIANIPANPSLSYTLDNLSSFVELEQSKAHQDNWAPLDMPGAHPFRLSDAAQTRFLKHLAYLKTQFNITDHFTIRSCNNFPMDSGLASSASSFAALTKAACRAFTELLSIDEPDLDKQAQLSRQGSGSSCRSFYAPWALWEGTEVNAINLSYPELLHEAVLISHDAKKISSREAHQRVTTSPHYPTRVERARARLKDLLAAFEAKAWDKIYQLCWEEFVDMHTLFKTATAPFSYMTPESQEVLNIIQNTWQQHGDGPLVTMDAGPNIHLLYRPDQLDLANRLKTDVFHDNYDLL